MAAYKPVAKLFFCGFFLAVCYRLIYEIPTYFWQCKIVEIISVKTVDLKYDIGISVAYKLKDQPKVIFSKVAPLAIDQDADVPAYPYRYLDMISSGSEQIACFSDSGTDAVLFEGVSLETLYYVVFLMFLLLLIVWRRKSSSVMN